MFRLQIDFYLLQAMASAPSTTTPEGFTVKQKGKLKKLKYKIECGNFDSSVPGYERKRTIKPLDNNRPYLSKYYSHLVAADTCAGHNHPVDFGYISKCNGVGGVIIYSVK